MKELRKVSQEELREILRFHELWLESDGGAGKLADLRYCDLRCADLRYCDLRYCDLSDTNLKYANLSNSDLRCSDLFYADLSGADLSNAKLSGANLAYVNLYKTNLFYAKVDNMIGINNVGNENRTVYYFYKEDRVICGCFDNTLEEFKKAVTEKYGADYGSYAIAIEVFEKMKDKK